MAEIMCSFGLGRGMNVKKLIMIGICIILVFLPAFCKNGIRRKEIKSPSQAQTGADESDKSIAIEDIENPKIIEEAKYYRLLRGNNHLYYYYVYDDNKEVVDEGGFYWRSPRISMVDDDIVKFCIQMGTGVSTSSTFYYSAKKDVLSRTFHSVYDETDELLIFSDHKKLIVRDIFDKTAFCREFTDFGNMSDVVEPFVNAEFINERQIKVTYLTGGDFREATEIIDLT